VSEPREPTLLLVDDEAHILSALRRALRREGWRLLTAETPQQALRLLEEQPVDLIVSDQKMPGMSGLELLAEAARRRPDTRRVLITGWTESVPPERLAALGVRAMIPKPWDDAELKATLRAQLADR
jgi:response regulator RpfG family c-di-GMP phosphodiesterase